MTPSVCSPVASGKPQYKGAEEASPRGERALCRPDVELSGGLIAARPDGRVRRRSDAVQCLREVRDQVVGMLEADRHAHVSGMQPHGGKALRCLLLEGADCR